MIPCIIESPFKGATKAEESRNRAYLNKCIRWCIEQGYSPYASHKMLVDSLDDALPNERLLGREAGLEMAIAILQTHPQAKVFVFQDYTPAGDGIQLAQERYAKYGLEERVQSLHIGIL